MARASCLVCAELLGGSLRLGGELGPHDGRRERRASDLLGRPRDRAQGQQHDAEPDLHAAGDRRKLGDHVRQIQALGMQHEWTQR